MKRIYFLLGILLAAFVGMGADGIFTELSSKGSINIAMTFTDSGDTAQVIKVNKFTANDSFTFIDTINSTTVEYTSALQAMRIIVDTPVDTSATLACSLDCGTHIYGFELVVPQWTTNLADSVEKRLKDSINVVAGMKDTVVASDSADYVKVLSKIGQQNLENGTRWTLKLSTGLTKGDSTYTTKKSVIDAIVAAINDSTALADTVTAANSGDTVYTITANKKGVSFTIAIGDTSQDTSLVRANKTSFTVDTVALPIGQCAGYQTMRGRVIVKPSAYTSHGVGLSDSCNIWIYSYLIDESDRKIFDSAKSEGLPCTLNTSLPYTTGDSLLRNYLGIKIRVRDSTTDTNMEVNYPIEYYINLK